MKNNKKDEKKIKKSVKSISTSTPKPRSAGAPSTVVPSKGKPKVKPAQKRRKKNPRAILLPVIPVILAGAAVIILLAISGSRTGSGFGGYLASFGSGGGYPINVDKSDAVSTKRIGSGIMLLSNDSVEILNSTAKELVRVQHTFLNPESDIANGRAVIYSRASGRVEVVNRSGVLYKTDLKKNILTAAIGKKGNIAIASQSISAQSDLTVLDKKGKAIFSWECAAERISAVALSGNGKSVAVAVVGAENTELYSRVLVFNFDKSEPVVEFKYSENAMIKLKFGNDETLIAVGDKMFSAISVKANTKQDVEHETGDILERFYTYENGKTAIVLSRFGNKMLSKLVVYGTTGKRLFETNCNQEIKWVSCDANYAVVLTEDEVQCFDNTGKLMGSFKVDKYSESVVVVGKHTYLFEKGVITRHNTVGLSR